MIARSRGDVRLVRCLVDCCQRAPEIAAMTINQATTVAAFAHGFDLAHVQVAVRISEMS